MHRIQKPLRTLLSNKAEVDRLLEDRHLADDVLGAADPADAHTGGEDLGEGPGVNGVARLVEGEDRRQVFAVETHIAVRVVLEDGEAVALRDRNAGLLTITSISLG